MRSQSQKLSQSRVDHLLQVREKHQEGGNFSLNSANRYLHSCNWHTPECQTFWCPFSGWLSTSRRASRLPLATALGLQSINGNPLPLYCFLSTLRVALCRSWCRRRPCRGTPRETCGRRRFVWIWPPACSFWRRRHRMATFLGTWLHGRTHYALWKREAVGSI